MRGFTSYLNSTGKTAATEAFIAKIVASHADRTSKLEAFANENAKKTAATSAVSGEQVEVSWKGQKVPVPNEKLQSIIMNIQKTTRDLENDANIESNISISRTFCEPIL